MVAAAPSNDRWGRLWGGRGGEAVGGGGRRLGRVGWRREEEERWTLKMNSAIFFGLFDEDLTVREESDR